MKKLTAILLLTVMACLMLVGCSTELNHSTDDILYNDIVYRRLGEGEFSYNLELHEDNKTYIGDFLETYDYGQQLPWEVYCMNEEANVLFSAHATWVRPGYSLPSEYGEVLTGAEYVISEGLLDTYVEETTPLVTFDKAVMLEDIIAAEPTEFDDPEALTVYADVRFYYADHADISLRFPLVSMDGVFYLNVRDSALGTDIYYQINSEYVDMLTSAIDK